MTVVVAVGGTGKLSATTKNLITKHDTIQQEGLGLMLLLLLKVVYLFSSATTLINYCLFNLPDGF